MSGRPERASAFLFSGAYPRRSPAGYSVAESPGDSDGGALGAAGGSFSLDGEVDEAQVQKGFLVGAAAFGAFGALVGTFIGGDTWERVPVDRLGMGYTMGLDGRHRLMASVHF
ncbi:MAG: hypothetical protein CME26_04205 [Gemmatimonadetes bacterium]|nr:hypothetical protein [Gemmatimonadota bacterium]